MVHACRAIPSASLTPVPCWRYTLVSQCRTAKSLGQLGVIYNFRHDRDRTAEIAARIEADHEVSQGWGGGEANLDILEKGFVDATRECYELNTTRIPTNLSRIGDLKDGDLLVMPHMPKQGCVSIHVVDGSFPECYRYEPEDVTHQNHRVMVRQSFGMGGEISARHVTLAEYHAQLRWLRLPVLPIPQYGAEFETIVRRMEVDATAEFRPSALDEFLLGVAVELEKLFIKRVRGISASGGDISFEKLCERLLTANGYRVERRNQYDGVGGDVDLVCKRMRGNTSIFETGEVTLFVQVKKHGDMSDAEGVKQVVAMQRAQPDADGCVMSSADGFTAEACSLAKRHGIALLGKRDIFQLAMQVLADLFEQ